MSYERSSILLQTGRKPSGLCGAALYISGHSHGLNYSKSDIVSHTQLLLYNDKNISNELVSLLWIIYYMCTPVRFIYLFQISNTKFFQQ